MIYDLNGTELDTAFDLNGDSLDAAYDLSGSEIWRAGIYPYIEDRICVFDENFLNGEIITDNWNYEIGYCRNNELQHYRPEAVSIVDNNLLIHATKEHYPGDTERNSTWISGSIQTCGKFEAFYGRWQARIKFPNVSGCWGADWLLGGGVVFVYYDDGTHCKNYGPGMWPEDGEVDIMETIPGNTNRAHANLWGMNGASNPHQSSFTIDLGQWHIYECEWTPTAMIMMVDGVPVYTYDLTNANFSQYTLNGNPDSYGFYLILNQAIGQQGGVPTESLTSMDMLVDFARVYAPANYTVDMISPTAISLSGSDSTTVGNPIVLHASFTPVNVFDRTIAWSSSDETIAIVHGGKVTPVSAGTVTITATTRNGLTASKTITIT